MTGARAAAASGLIAAVLLLAGDDAERRPTAPARTPAFVDIPPRPVDEALRGSDAELMRRYPVEPWATDLDRSVIDQRELLVARRRDTIPPLDAPRFEAAGAATWLAADEPVLVHSHRGDARAYPLSVLLWHEVVNDRVGGRPVAVTYCPLCNSAVVFDRRVAGRKLRFGTSGRLRRANLVMWDRRTETLWQQVTGEALVGRYAGRRLRALAFQILPWREAAGRFPGLRVLSRTTGHDRAYGTTPYAGLDERRRPPLFSGRLDLRRPAMERTVALFGPRTTLALPLSRVRRGRVVDVELDGRPVAVWPAGPVRSVLDEERIGASRLVASVGAFEAAIDGRRLRFEATRTGYRDEQTGSTWDVAGRAVDGPLEGKRLRPVRHDVGFWFALAALVPELRLVE